MATSTVAANGNNVLLALLIPLCMYFRMQSANAGRLEGERGGEGQAGNSDIDTDSVSSKEKDALALLRVGGINSSP